MNVSFLAQILIMPLIILFISSLVPFLLLIIVINFLSSKIPNILSKIVLFLIIIKATFFINSRKSSSFKKYKK